MTRHSRRTFATAAVAVAAIGVSAAGAGAKAKAPPPPSLRMTGISVNQQNVKPGTTITPRSPINACYGIGGPTADPQSVQVFFFLHAVSIPKSAPTTVKITTPWDTQTLPNPQEPASKFSQLWFTDRGHGAATAFGGPSGKYDYYRYDDEGTGTNTFDGRYTIVVTAQVRGRTLRAHGAITVAC